MPPRKKTDDIVNQIKEVANSPVRKDDERVEFISSGSTLLNLALSQRGENGGFARGRICNVVGDKASAKTLLCLETCAHVFHNPQKLESKIYPPIEKINIIFNNIEGSLDFPISQMYGKTFNESINWIQTPIAEDFGKDYQQRLAALKKGEFMLYILDSIDALVSQAAADRMTQTLSDKKADASYGVEKAKFFSSSFFNHLCGGMRNKDSTLICVSQIRENINVMFGEKYYRTGGKSFDFYAQQVLWLAVVEKMKKTFRGKDKIYGVKVRGKVKKNKTALPFREADFKILFDFGIDDIGSMIDYLYGPKEKEYDWQGQKIKSSELINLIDNSPEDLKLLKKLVEEDWYETEQAIKPERRNRWE